MNWLDEYSMIRDWYALKDDKSDPNPTIPITPRTAKDFNDQRYAIHWTVNDFGHEPRLKKNVKRVLCFAIDLDHAPKELQRERIAYGPSPSLIVESKNGYHVYYNLLENDLNMDSYREIILDHFLDPLGGDAGASDVSRILRVPFFNHWKDQNDPYQITIAHISNSIYSVEQLKKLFPISEKRKAQRAHIKHMQSETPFMPSEAADTIYEMDQLEALKRISGHPALKGTPAENKIYSFKPVTGGKYNVFVNGKSSAAWIDTKRKIGSTSGGGPTVFQWLNWYLNDKKKTFEILKQIFPEKFNNE